ncbi:hypothetical protein [Streptomyces sp. NPDC048665]|uniref:hypothetical protein n=1 Tax=Streptomyces sp. NPDC048665 TaxID=3155490 RepID=UPI00341AA99A
MPSDLEVAISVGQQLSNSDSLMAVREALRLLLRALDAEVPRSGSVGDQAESLSEPGSFRRRCLAAHPEDPTPCGGPVVVTILDRQNAGTNGCEHHAARLLASLEGGRVYALPDAPEGAAIRVFKAAGTLRPFPWLTDVHLCRAENRERGEGQ